MEYNVEAKMECREEQQRNMLDSKGVGKQDHVRVV
jgi:hypothetical protein